MFHQDDSFQTLSLFPGRLQEHFRQQEVCRDVLPARHRKRDGPGPAEAHQHGHAPGERLHRGHQVRRKTRLKSLSRAYNLQCILLRARTTLQSWQSKHPCSLDVTDLGIFGATRCSSKISPLVRARRTCMRTLVFYSRGTAI